MKIDEKSIAFHLSRKISKHISSKDHFADFIDEEGIEVYTDAMSLYDMQDLIQDKSLIMDQLEQELISDREDEKVFNQSKRNGSLRLFEYLCTDVLPKKVPKLLSASAELRAYFVNRIKSEVPAIFHQYLQVCDETVRRIYDPETISILTINDEKEKIDQRIESIKYSCLFSVAGNSLVEIVNKAKDGQINANDIKGVSSEMYYLVCYEAMNKFLQVVGKKELKYKEMTNYHLEELYKIAGNNREARLVIEMSQDPFKLTISDTTPDVEKLKKQIKPKLLKAGEDERKQIEDFIAKQTNVIKTQSGVLVKDPSGFWNHGALFKNPIEIHEEQEDVPGANEIISKYQIVSKIDRKWETNSIVVDLSSHFKRALGDNQLPEELVKAVEGRDFKFRVIVSIYSRVGVFV